ncbi:MAG: insulinase family protein, partial [Chloroflexota bacterium]
MTTRAFDLQLPVSRHQLSNGLRVVLSADHSAPIICVAAYYHVGMRLEPRGRTGFAHLFEHLMFQGSASMAKME